MYPGGWCVNGYTPVGEGGAADHQRSFIVASFLLFNQRVYFCIFSRQRQGKINRVGAIHMHCVLLGKPS